MNEHETTTLMLLLCPRVTDRVRGALCVSVIRLMSFRVMSFRVDPIMVLLCNTPLSNASLRNTVVFKGALQLLSKRSK